MVKELIVASGNQGKIKEVQSILKDYKVISIKEIGKDIDIEEDAKTFEGNAKKKALEISKIIKGKKILADDSGIEIPYLDGFPGVFTKRWFTGTDRQRNLEIIKKLEGVEKENRKVKFISAIAVAEDGKVITEVSTINGYITLEPRGTNGFGFDEIFELEDLGKTLAELSDEEKNMISARKKSLEKIKSKIN